MHWSEIASSAKLLPRHFDMIDHLVNVPKSTSQLTRSFELEVTDDDPSLYVSVWFDEIQHPAYLESVKGIQIALEDVFTPHDPVRALERVRKHRREPGTSTGKYRIWPVHAALPEDKSCRRQFEELVHLIMAPLNDVTDLRWDEMKRALSDFRIVAELKCEAQPGTTANDLIHDLVCAISFLLSCKWEIGAGNCWQCPDPREIEYPRTSVEWRLEWEWMSNVEFQIEEQISAELGLRWHDTFWRSDSGVDYDDYQRRVREYFESGDSDRERALIHDEMRRRGITFQDFAAQNVDRFPPQGKFRSFTELLNDAEANLESLSVGTLYSVLGSRFSRVWNDYFGWRVLFDESGIDLGRRLEQLGRRLDRFHFAHAPKLVSYRLIETIEKAVHSLVQERLKDKFGPKESEWYVQGLHRDLRVELAARREADADREDPITYIYLIEYKAVIERNWSCFEDVFGSPIWGGTQRKSRLSGIDRLTNIRNRVGHSMRKGVSLEEFQFLQSLVGSLPV